MVILRARMTPGHLATGPLLLAICAVLGGCARRQSVPVQALVYEAGTALTASGRVSIPNGCPWVGKITLTIEPLQPAWPLYGSSHTITFVDQGPVAWPARLGPPQRAYLYAEALPLRVTVHAWGAKSASELGQPHAWQETASTKGYQVSAHVPQGFTVTPRSYRVSKSREDLDFRIRRQGTRGP